MKKGTYILIIVLIFFLIAAAAVLSLLYFELSPSPVRVPAHSYIEIDLSGDLQEYTAPDFWSRLFLPTRQLSLYDLWMNIRKARADPRVDTLLFRLGYLSCNWAKVSEIRDAVLDFRKSGKKAYAYIDEAPDFDKEYFLATACDRIILHPMGWLGINGIGGTVPFFKNALDKLGIQAEFEHVEQYKTATNMFTEKGFTPAHKEMMESLYGDIFAEYVKTVAAARNKSEEEVRRLIDQAFFQGESAVKAGLVDDLMYDDELDKLLDDRGWKSKRVSFDDYTRVKLSSFGLDQGKKIALIYGQGPIVSGEGFFRMMGGATLARWIRQARMDSTISAIVFRVDSPGGSAIASDVIWREVALAKKTKPFVVSMSDVAGSGGYWVSMAAHKIVAQPQTLTGSIGVLTGKFNLAGLAEKLGITTEKLIYGKEADVFSPLRGLTDEEKRLFKQQILWIYDQFLAKVAQGRNMSQEDVDKIGRGRVWTGRQAKELGLVDELGGLPKALELAKKLAGIPLEAEVKLAIWPKKVSFWGSIFGRKESEVLTLPGLDKNTNKILAVIERLEGDRIWALMPFWFAPN